MIELDIPILGQPDADNQVFPSEFENKSESGRLARDDHIRYEALYGVRERVNAKIADHWRAQVLSEEDITGHLKTLKDAINGEEAFSSSDDSLLAISYLIRMLDLYIGDKPHIGFFVPINHLSLSHAVLCEDFDGPRVNFSQVDEFLLELGIVNRGRNTVYDVKWVERDDIDHPTSMQHYSLVDVSEGVENEDDYRCFFSRDWYEFMSRMKDDEELWDRFWMD